MVQDLTPAEKMRVSTLLSREIPRASVSVRNSNPQDLKKLQPILAQKIAYESTLKPLPPPPNQTPLLQKLCFCFFPQTYASYFDVTTELFLKRFMGTLLFWRSDFLTIGGNKYQLYGPMWIGLTYACILSVAANLSSYFIAHDQFVFNAEYVVRAFGVVLVFGLLMPMLIGLAVRCMKGEMPILASLCIYGYSLIWFMLPTALCFIPSLWWQVGMLCLGGFFNCVFLLRNYHAYTGKDLQSNIYLLHICIITFQVIYFFIIKQFFFKDYLGLSLQQGSKNIHHLQHHNYHKF